MLTQINTLQVISGIILLFGFPVTSQDDLCYLPDGLTQAKCERLHRCAFFMDQIKPFGSGKLPQNLITDIYAHVCGNNNFVCCPDNIIVKVGHTEEPPPPAKLVKLEDIRNHPNYKLVNARSCGASASFRIGRGLDAPINQYPWAVLLGYTSELGDEEMKWDCGGSLISRRFVLTAAHCLGRHLEIARLGEQTKSTDPDCDDLGSCTDPYQDIKVESTIRHPSYVKSTWTNDIALLKLQTLADVSKMNVNTICLPTEDENDIEKVKKRSFTLTGWGSIGGGESANVLQATVMKYMSTSDCAGRLTSALSSENFCAGGYDKIHACKGDSGGGLTSTARVKGIPRVVLYGVLSGGVNCGNPNDIFPDVYMNVKYYLDWIMENITE